MRGESTAWRQTNTPAYFRVIRPRAWGYVRACAWYVWISGDRLFRNRGPLRWRA